MSVARHWHQMELLAREPERRAVPRERSLYIVRRRQCQRCRPRAASARWAQRFSKGSPPPFPPRAGRHLYKYCTCCPWTAILRSLPILLRAQPRQPRPVPPAGRPNPPADELAVRRSKPRRRYWGRRGDARESGRLRARRRPDRPGGCRSPCAPAPAPTQPRRCPRYGRGASRSVPAAGRSCTTPPRASLGAPSLPPRGAVEYVPPQRLRPNRGQGRKVRQ